MQIQGAGGVGRILSGGMRPAPFRNGEGREIALAAAPLTTLEVGQSLPTNRMHQFPDPSPSRKDGAVRSQKAGRFSTD